MSNQGRFHERLSVSEEVKIGTERSFGLVFAVVFLIVALFPLLGGNPPLVWALAVSGLFLAAALAFPWILRSPNRIWFRFGLLLHRIVSPVVMGFLFFGTVTPIALLFRLRGKDPLKLRLDPAAPSYWIVRQPPGPAPDTLKNQF